MAVNYFDRLQGKKDEALKGSRGWPQFQPSVRPFAGIQTGIQTGAGQQDPYQTISTPRNEELSNRIREILGAQKSNQGSTDNALNRYENTLNRGEVKGYANQEADYLSNIYGGGLESRLDALRDKSADAMRGAADLASQNLRRDLKMAGFRSRGGAGSRLDRMAADRSYQIETGLANQMANRERSDFDYMNQLQSSNIGRRQGIMDSLASRELLPMQARNQMFNQQLNQLGQIGQMDRTNSIYHLAETPEYSQAREYQSALEAQGIQPYSMPGTGYANYDVSQTEPWARFPKQPFSGYGVNPVNGLQGYQYSAPLYNNYPTVLQRV
jgi:hypothetical protein